MTDSTNASSQRTTPEGSQVDRVTAILRRIVAINVSPEGYEHWAKQLIEAATPARSSLPPDFGKLIRIAAAIRDGRMSDKQAIYEELMLEFLALEAAIASLGPPSGEPA